MFNQIKLVKGRARLEVPTRENNEKKTDTHTHIHLYQCSNPQTEISIASETNNATDHEYNEFYEEQRVRTKKNNNKKIHR